MFEHNILYYPNQIFLFLYKVNKSNKYQRLVDSQITYFSCQCFIIRIRNVIYV